VKRLEPAAAYDLWAAQYDRQPANLVLHLDEAVFTELVVQVDLENKTVVDIGCGTGRHWGRLLERKPLALVGYDVSAEMLKCLRRKFPEAKAWLLRNGRLEETADDSVDSIVSTLTIAHMDDLPGRLREWNRVLKKNASILVTDYHPTALEKGADRTFTHNGETIAIKSRVYGVEELRRWTAELGWREMAFTERKIDEAVKHYYARQQALHLYERFRDTPIVYGMLLMKA
jgi:ubiquinone/menaquinone biosynthesis C-methylase UbiE